MKRISVFFRFALCAFATGLLAPCLSSAATSDFVCIPAQKAHAVYFETQVRNCGDPKADVKKGVCQEDVQCAFVDPDTQKAVEAAYAKDHPALAFSTIPLTDKLKLMTNYRETLSYHPSVVTCEASHASAGGPTCPAPDECRGDALIDSRSAPIDSAETLALPVMTVPTTDGAPSAGGANVR